MDQKMNGDEQSEGGGWKTIQEMLNTWPEWLIFGTGTALIAGIFLVLSKFDAILDLFFALNLLLWFFIYGFMAPGYLIERTFFGISGYTGTDTGFILFSGLAGFLSLIIWFLVGAFIGNLKIDYMKRFYILVALVILAAGGSFRLFTH